MNSTVVGTIWVCTCCLFAREGDGDGCDGNGGCAGNPWALIGDGYEVTMGMSYEEHAEDCTEEIRQSEGCDCESLTFTWSSCDGCGSTLGGARQAYTLWRREESK